MTWHLLACDPNRFKIPASHRIRAVSHDEFRDLARNLEEFWKERAIIVRDSVDLVVLRRLTGLKVLRCSLDGIEEINHEKLPKRLARGDFVLAFQPLVDGMYVNWAYDRADTARFKEMVATWVIEPSDGKYLEPLRITSLARQFATLNNKINRTIELLAQSRTIQAMLRMTSQKFLNSRICLRDSNRKRSDFERTRFFATLKRSKNYWTNSVNQSRIWRMR